MDILSITPNNNCPGIRKSLVHRSTRLRLVQDRGWRPPARYMQTSASQGPDCHT